MPSFIERIKNGWNAFTNNKDPSTFAYQDLGYSSYYRPDRPRLLNGNERSIINSIFNRLAVDAASIEVLHARLDENHTFMEEIDSKLNRVLNISANIDQTGRALVQDIAMSMFDEGCVAVVPTDTDINPNYDNSYDILELRVGKIVEWRPNHVKVNLYNERTGLKEDVLLSKSAVAIIENPFYSVMNEPNSILKRLSRKLSLLDVIDEQNSSKKLDLIIQLPYVVKTEARRKQAEIRRKDIEKQLAEGKYGIAYTDATEHITQLNRSLENNMMGQIEYLTNMLFSQLGLTPEIMNGTASEEVMMNYYNRTIEPILTAITEEMTRKFLTKTARTQGQAIIFIRDPFKLVPISNMADLGDKFIRNEILTANEVRGKIGFKPSNEPKANQLGNPNMPVSEQIQNKSEETDEEGNPVVSELSQEELAQLSPEELQEMLDDLDETDAQLDEIEKET